MSARNLSREQEDVLDRVIACRKSLYDYVRFVWWHVGPPALITPGKIFDVESQRHRIVSQIKVVIIMVLDLSKRMSLLSRVN